jgi:aryl-alcohol dehydrogenase-like predicted oxidoreductase
LIREALHPYPESVLISTKVGARRDAEGGWPTARTPDDLRQQVRDNLESLGVERLDLVNMRMGNANGPQPGSITEAMETLVELQREGLIAQPGVSNLTDRRESARPRDQT